MVFDVAGKAPGKILWIGGYSVLERPNISLVTTVDAYVSANVKSLEGDELVIETPLTKSALSGSIDLKTGKVRIDVPQELTLLKTAVEVALRYASSMGANLEGMRLKTENDDPLAYKSRNGKVVKSGLGSSAAVTVAVIGIILAAYKLDTSEDDALHKLAQLAHSIATGKVGSGFDIAAAVHGTILYTRYSPELVRDFPKDFTNEQLKALIAMGWDYKIEKIEFPENFHLTFGTFVDEGMVTTSAIGSVSKFKSEDPDAYRKIMADMDRENILAISALKKVGKDASALAEFRDAFEKGRILAKRLGKMSNVEIEPDDCTLLIAESRKHGSFVAKLPGAGGRDAISAISLDEDSKKNLQAFWNSKPSLEVMRLSITNHGFQAHK